MRTRGYTVLELLVAAGILAVVAISSARAFSSVVGFDEKLASSRDAAATRQTFESRLRTLIGHAHLSPDATATDSFFVASEGVLESGSTETESSGTADTLTFTFAGERIAGALVDPQDDFETLNQQYGPQGGIAEATISTSPSGDAAGATGLFLRSQRPADSDPAQGGTERVFQGDVVQISFELFDGTDWLTNWDTRTMTTKRLPAAVRVTYRFQDDETDHVMTISLPESDVTTDNPVTVAG